MPSKRTVKSSVDRHLDHTISTLRTEIKSIPTHMDHARRLSEYRLVHEAG